MSTELYFSVEAQNAQSGRWWHFGRFRVSNDYALFALLAGVRAEPGDQECLKPKGLPADVTELTLEEDSFTIDDEAAGLEVPDTCTGERASQWVNEGRSRFLHHGYAVTHPDFHSHSWLMPDELRAVLDLYVARGGRDADAIRSVLAAMEAFRAEGVSSAKERVVSRWTAPWGPQTTDGAGRFDDESFSYPRVAQSAEPHDRSPSRGNAVLRRGPP